jgi:hypothetical protein
MPRRRTVPTSDTPAPQIVTCGKVPDEAGITPPACIAAAAYDYVPDNDDA